MRTRRKPPTLVSMWMLDVFCCALGCVTLLWLLNTRETAEQAQRAVEALAEVARTEAELIAGRGAAEEEQARLGREVAGLRADLDRARAAQAATAEQLAAATAARDRLAGDLKASNEASDDQKAMLARQGAKVDELGRKLAAEATRADELARQLSGREDEAKVADARLQRAERELSDAAGKLKTAQQSVSELSRDRVALGETSDKLAVARRQSASLQKQLDAANVQIIDLQGDKAKLADRFDKLKSDADNRFAGIALTGQRVAFVVDTSGSMKMVDRDTPAPAKWGTVCDTLARLMRSLAGLEQVQVVTFSRTAKYLLPGGDWVPYQGETTVKQARDALAALDPAEGTNLHAGLELAFRLRPAGLDTVYLLSDGLPTDGPGVPDLAAGRAQTPLEERDRNELLTRALRRTLRDDWNRASGRGRVRINTVGFFFESPEVGAFLWALARENDGSFVGMSRP